ncbi:hypothetical protein PR048_024186 [Dryococelus australis]|uniref:Uncharacterized protein n=1 Tax=Dryococelus australis TaxID=614101 RepID=A0ABQ9GWA6_9NEOP|nr:hypothetical protein PR048_024186 [Dryococelus australis]
MTYTASSARSAITSTRVSTECSTKKDNIADVQDNVEGNTLQAEQDETTCLHLNEPGSIPGGVAPGFSHVGIVSDDATDYRIFSGVSHFPLPFISMLLHPHLTSSPSALETSMQCPDSPEVHTCAYLSPEVTSQVLSEFQEKYASIQGTAVVERLDCSPPIKANRFQYPACSLRIFAGRCRWSADIIGDLPFPPPFHSGPATYLASPSSALKTSIDTGEEDHLNSGRITPDISERNQAWSFHGPVSDTHPSCDVRFDVVLAEYAGFHKYSVYSEQHVHNEDATSYCVVFTAEEIGNLEYR